MEERHQNATNTMHYQVITCNISCGFQPPDVQKVDNAIVQLFSLKLMDHYTFRGNCPPTPPLSQR